MFNDEAAVSQEQPATQQEPAQQPVQQAEQQPAPAPTLDDVYRDAEVDKLLQPAPSQPAATPQPAAPQQPAAPVVPDPYDTAAFKAYIENVAKGNTTLQGQLQQVTGFLSQQVAAQQKAALEADIRQAVETVNAVVGHPKPKVIEAMIDGKAREDVRFKALWENRSKNPSAWNNALKAVAREFADEVSVKVDPKLVEAQRVRKIAQGQMATTAPEEPDASWDGLAPDEFQQRWERSIRGEQ